MFHSRLARHLPLSSILLVGLSMSIGWGIRGNFGHQYGAAFAGCLASMILCLLSGREDWQKKLLYFGFFGAVGWGFGATISYMQVISYTESGHASTQWFGYFSLFIIGFLWAALGVAAIAWASVTDIDSLMKFFKPLFFVFAAWVLLDIIEDPVAELIQPAMPFDSNRARQRNPFYWFDANYLPPLFALMGIGVYDIVERMEKKSWLIFVFALIGASAGWFIQYGLKMAGLEQKFSASLTYSLGDPSYINPDTGKAPYDAANLLNNWPQWFNDFPQHTGWIIGLMAGIIFFFIRFGKFRNGASLIVCMAGGWFIFFLAFPVLGSLFFKRFGGIRMTPPRSDDWAGIAGVFAGALFWLRKNNYTNIATASIIGGAIGGLGFSGIQWIKQLMMAPGNPRILQARGLLPGNSEYDININSWSSWQHQNWHSFLEQSYGFVNGIAIAIAIGLLAKKIPKQNNELKNEITVRFKKWVTGFCVVFILLIVPYVNIIKNIEVWGDALKPEIWQQVIISPDGTSKTIPAQWNMPYAGHLPGIHFLKLGAEGWFNTIWILLLFALAGLINRHYKYPLAFVPKSWMGRAQLLILILLWVMVIGNFERELLQWTPQRLLTEWVITVNAVILTYFILAIPKETGAEIIIQPLSTFKPLYKRSWQMTLGAIIICSTFFLFSNRWVYQYSPNEKLDTKRIHIRFGPRADWRTMPILKNGEHK